MYQVVTLSTKNTTIKDWKLNNATNHGEPWNGTWYLEYPLNITSHSDIGLDYMVITNPTKITYQGGSSSDYWKENGLRVSCQTW